MFLDSFLLPKSSFYCQIISNGKPSRMITMINQVKKVLAHVKHFYTPQNSVATGHGNPWPIRVFTCSTLPLVLVKLIKGHFTHFKLGCFFISIPFQSVIFSFCILVIIFGVNLQEIPSLSPFQFSPKFF